ncbi:hypothetical protein HHK36_027304 [Tetracentron sinense]|uniref:Alanyl-tRNA synthetase class IIc N-terminal domain-containing protein n=1 Tax=Tetracentron sinense TaxID=13715 RepID=A0A834YME4_TETSI|nr:hypothetical protein HHK36_027304 [Tetracentron sinense]
MDVFVLWDTYGFPLDLTQLMAEERGLTVDVEGLNTAMDEAWKRSRNAQNKVLELYEFSFILFCNIHHY